MVTVARKLVPPDLMESPELSALRKGVVREGMIDLQRRVLPWIGALRAIELAAPDEPHTLYDTLLAPLLRHGGQALADVLLLRSFPNIDPVVAGPALLELAARTGLGRPPSLVEIARDRSFHGLYGARELTRRHRWRDRMPLPAPCDVLIVPRNHGHMSDLVPTARELLRRDVRAHFVDLGPSTLLAVDGARLPGGPPLGAGIATWTPALVRVGRRALARARSARPVGYSTDEREALLYATECVLRRELPRAVVVADGADRELDARRPRAVIVGNPYTMEGRTYALAARKRGIPAYALQHGTIFSNDPYWSWPSVDRVLVWGEATVENLVASGVDRAAIVIVGAPRTDPFVGRSHRGSHTVLVATSGGGDQVSHEAHAGFIEMLCEVASRRPSLRIVVKLHPKDRPELYEAALLRHPGVRFDLVRSSRTGHGTDIFGHLREALTLVTVLSTTALDAMVAGVPVIGVCPPGLGAVDQIGFYKHRAVARVDTVEEWVARLDELVSGAPDPAWAERAAAFADRQYANRVTLPPLRQMRYWPKFVVLDAEGGACHPPAPRVCLPTSHE